MKRKRSPKYQDEQIEVSVQWWQQQEHKR